MKKSHPVGCEYSVDISSCVCSEYLEGVKGAPRPNEKAPPPLAGAAGAAIGLHYNVYNATFPRREKLFFVCMENQG